MALSMRCSSGRMVAVAGLGEVSSFFFFFCAEAVEESVRQSRRKREKKRARLAAMRMLEETFQSFMLDLLPKFQARFGL